MYRPVHGSDYLPMLEDPYEIWIKILGLKNEFG